MADIKFSAFVAGLSADTIGGSEKIPVIDTTPFHVTPNLLRDYIIAALTGSTAVTPTAGDAIVMERGGVAGTFDLAAFAAYIVASGWTVASEASPATNADKLLIERSGTIYELDIDTLATYINSSVGTLGAQVNALSTATLADTDEYLVEQGGVALKTGWPAIAARAHSQFQTYLGTLTSVTALADANTFYVDQGGTAKKITAEVLADYILAEIGTEVISAAFDFDAVSPAVTGDLMLLERSGVGKRITVDNVAAFAVASQTSATAADPVVAGDDFLMFRGSTQYQVDAGVLSTYVLKQAWDATSGNPVATGDKVMIGRSGTTYSVTVDQLQTFVQAGAQAASLNFSGLDTATLADADLFAVTQGTTGKKVAASAVASYVQAEVGGAIIASAWDFDVVSSGASGDVFVIERSNVGKTITINNVAAYAVGTQASASVASPALATDDLVMFRSGVQMLVGADTIGTFALTQAFATASGNPVTSGDKLAIGRSGTTLSVTVDQLQTFVLTGNQQNVLNFSGLTAVTLAGTDLFAVYDGSSGKKVTLTNLETKLWADYQTYVAALTAVTASVDADVFYCIQGGTPKKVTADVLAAYIDDEIWADASAASPAATGDDLLIRRSGTTMALDIDVLATYINGSSQATILNISGLTSATLDATDLFLIGESTNPRKATLAQLETKLWADFETYVEGLAAVATTASNDLFYCIQGGTPKYVTPAVLTTFFNTTNGDVIGPITSTQGYIPAWSATNKTLDIGYQPVTSVRTVAGGASNTALATELAVRNAIWSLSSLDVDGGTDIGADLAGTDLIIVDDGANGTNRKCEVSRVATYVSANLSGAPITALDIDGGTDIGADLADADLLIVDDGASGTNRKSAMSRVWTYIQTKVQALSAKTTPVDADILTIQDSADSNALKKLTIANLKTAIFTAFSISNIDLDGGADIGADLVDADLIMVDDGASGTNRKSTMSRVWTYISAKLQGAAAKTTPVDADLIVFQDSENANTISEVTVGNLWDNRYLTDMRAADIAGATWLLDEDNFATNSATKVPSQQSVKAYVDGAMGGLNNFSATANPVAGDDNLDGYSVGSLWVNTTTDAAFICVDSSTGAAVWVSTTVAAAGWDGDLTDVDWATGADVGADLAAGDQIVVADNSDSDNPKRATMARVKKYAAKVQTASYAANRTLTSDECHGYIVYMTATGTLTLPAVTDGMSVTVITIGTVAVSIDPNASDKIWLDGVALDDGDKITNLSTAGDMAVLTYYSADGWHAATNGWTDGGA
jgi:uncharacterized protein YjbI with pentapeptide repeats